MIAPAKILCAMIPDTPIHYLMNLVSAARQLSVQDHAAEIELLSVTPQSDEVLKIAGTAGIKTVHLIDLQDNHPAAIDIANEFAQFLNNHSSASLVFSHHQFSLDTAAVLSGLLNIPFLPAVTALTREDGQITATRRIFGGSILEKIRLKPSPVMITIVANEFEPIMSDNQFSPPEVIPFKSTSILFSGKLTEIELLEKSIPINDARIIVAAGKGILNSPFTPDSGLSGAQLDQWKYGKGMELLQQLAESLGAAVGVTRALVDSGLAPYELQIGQTGKMVSPQVYIACGISGAMQHTMGMRNSHFIIAINANRQAPIFNVAHLGIVADMFEILPGWIAARQK